MIPMNDVTEKVLQANGGMMESMLRLGAVAMENQNQLASQQMALFEKAMSLGDHQMALLKDVRDPSEYLSKAAALLSDYGQEMGAAMRETMEMQVQMGTKLVEAMQAQMPAQMPAQILAQLTGAGATSTPAAGRTPKAT